MKQVLVLRKDLNMRKGKMIAQGAHASLKVVMDNLNDPNVKYWMDNAFTKIAVSVNSEEELLDLYKKAQDANIISCVIVDNGLTEFNGIPTTTCIAVGPAPNEIIDSITGNLKLL